MRLYELAQDYNTILDTEDLSDEQIVEHLDNIKAQFNEKVVNTGKVILTLKAEVKAVKSEIDRLAARQKSLEHKAEWLESYLLDNMIDAKQNKVEGDVLSISIRPNPPSVKIINLAEIPNSFCIHIPEGWQPDKKLIADHFKRTGEVVAGVEIVTDKKSVVIK